MESGAAEFDPEFFADKTSPPIACNEVRGGNLGQTSIGAPQDQIDDLRALLKVDQFGAEPCLGASLADRMRAEIIPQLLLENRLAKRIPPRIADIPSRLGEPAENKIRPALK